MDGITPEKTHALLEKLTHHVMTEIPVRKEMDDKIAKIDEKVDMLANYMMKELPTRQEVDGKIDKLVEYVMNEVATKTEFQELKDKVDTIIDGIDKQTQQLDIIRTEQIAFDHAFSRIDKRVEKLERAHCRR